MPIELTNTLSRQKEQFVAIKDGHISMYTCGPTVYHYIHIGNHRTLLLADITRRMFTYLGYAVKDVMNITDVGHLTSDADTDGDDKLEKGASREGKTVWEVAQYYTDSFLADMKKLNMLPPSILCKATDHIEQQIAMIKVLEEKGYTYDNGDVIYFDTSKVKDYGKIAKLTQEQLDHAQARVAKDTTKRNSTDFALWLKCVGKHENHIMRWESPWGEGFPGWHIECSAMSSHYLGEQFDIHIGGMDLSMVHHPNEIAQSEAAYGKIPWVSYWLHGEFIEIDNKKMARSSGDFLTITSLQEKGYHPLVYRFLVLGAHYRSKLHFNWDSMKTAQSSYNRLKNRVEEITRSVKTKETLTENAVAYDTRFKEKITNDLDMPGALAEVWSMVRDDTLRPDEQLQLIEKFDTVLGLDLTKKTKIVIPDDIQDMVKQRELARQNKDFKLADSLREKIEKKGYSIKDTDTGTVVSSA